MWRRRRLDHGSSVCVWADDLGADLEMQKRSRLTLLGAKRMGATNCWRWRSGIGSRKTPGRMCRATCANAAWANRWSSSVMATWGPRATVEFRVYEVYRAPTRAECAPQPDALVTGPGLAAAGVRQPPRRPWPSRGPATKWRASVASDSHRWSATRASTMTHSIIGRPLPASNGRPSPLTSRASTRWRGNFSTRWPRLTMAKIRPSTCNASEPNPRRPVPRVTPARPPSVSARTPNRCSTPGTCGPGNLPPIGCGAAADLLKHFRPMPPVDNQGDRRDQCFLRRLGSKGSGCATCSTRPPRLCFSGKGSEERPGTIGHSSITDAVFTA